MKINRLQGLLENVKQLHSPNHDHRPENVSPSLIIIHNISLPPGEFGGNAMKVASHLLIRRDGEVIQYVPFHRCAFHAGVSSFRGRENCNDFSVGIELEGSDYVAFTDIQYERLISLITVLCETYPDLTCKKITGHQHVAPGRKTDPGPFFDWERLAVAFGVDLPAEA